MDYLRDFENVNSRVNRNINSILSPLDNPAVANFLKLCLVLYAGLAAPVLPDSVLKWFSYVPFRIFVLFLIVWTSSQDPTMGILVAVAFYTSMNVLAGRKAFEAFNEIPDHAEDY